MFDQHPAQAPEDRNDNMVNSHVSHHHQIEERTPLQAERVKAWEGYVRLLGQGQSTCKKLQATLRDCLVELHRFKIQRKRIQIHFFNQTLLTLSVLLWI